MPLNVPATHGLALDKGSWNDIPSPAKTVIEVELVPTDYFQPVDPETARSCVPLGGTVTIAYNANIGSSVSRSESNLKLLQRNYHTESGVSIEFEGSRFRLSFMLRDGSELLGFISYANIAIPTAIGVASGISVRVVKVDLKIGDETEARLERQGNIGNFRIVSEKLRDRQVDEAISMLPLMAKSARFAVACSYLHEAQESDSWHFGNNPELHALQVILKCSHVVEVLFGGNRDNIRESARRFGIDAQVVERDLIPIILVRNEFGSGHGTTFLASGPEADVLKRFAARSVGTCRQLLRHIANSDESQRQSLYGKPTKDPHKIKLIEKLREYLRSPGWGSAGDPAVDAQD